MNQQKKTFEGCLKKAKNKAIIDTLNIELGEKFLFCFVCREKILKNI